MSEKIVVGVDGSENADEALRWAVDHARGRDAVVHVVTAWVWEQVVGVPGARFPVETQEEAVERAESTIAEALDRLGSDAAEGVEIRRVVEFGVPSRVLLDAASDADLLVVGSRGRGGFAGLLLGSVSQQCVTHASCPTVVVPPKGS